MISSPFWKNSARWLAAWASNFKIAAPDWLLLTALGNLFSFLVSQKERIFHREKSKKIEKGLSILKSGETISHRGLGSKAHYDREQKEKKGNYIQFSRLTLLWPTELSVWIEKNKHTPLKRPKKNTEKKNRNLANENLKREHEPSTNWNGWKERSIRKGLVRVWCGTWFGPAQQGAQVIYDNN